MIENARIDETQTKLLMETIGKNAWSSAANVGVDVWSNFHESPHCTGYGHSRHSLPGQQIVDWRSNPFVDPLTVVKHQILSRVGEIHAARESNLRASQ